MKKLIIALVFVISGVAANAQLFHKVDANDFKVAVKGEKGVVDTVTVKQINKWTAIYGVTATSFNLKDGSVGFLSSSGFGAARTWYNMGADGKPYKTFGVGGMLLFGKDNNTAVFASGGNTDVGVLASFSVSNISVGPTYFFASKQLLLNIGAIFTF